MSVQSAGGLTARVQACVESSLNELNAIRPKDQQVGLGADVRLLGDGGALDSLGFVNFVVTLDGHLAQQVAPTASVMADLLAAPDPEAFATVGLLVRFVSDKLAAE
jgi:acyl carrier protein